VSEAITAEEVRHAPLFRPDPVIRADVMAHVVFERRDVTEMGRFLADFGFIAGEDKGDTRYFRGHGPMPFLVAVVPSDRDRFAGFAVHASGVADLDLLSAATGLPIEPFPGPGGGRCVRLTDPNGLAVDVIHGAAMLDRLPMREALIALNTPFEKPRTNQGVRTPRAPSEIYKLGHVVLRRPDFEAAADWYMRHLGLIPSDVQVLADGTPAMAFMRLDRGAEPADHHSLAIAVGPAAGLLHTSFETFDIESVGQGHQHLRAQGWTPFWGIGRHQLGSQVFDYWKDPVGDEWEHYADGDVLDASQPTGYHAFDRGTLWSWGDDLPASMRPDLDPAAIDHIHASGAFGDMGVEKVRQLMSALQIPPRPWMR
jgi:catechol 2,3-dioxygenase-like lactoylglutathione lyase family enzyme